MERFLTVGDTSAGQENAPGGGSTNDSIINCNKLK